MIKKVNFLGDISHTDRDALVEKYVFGMDFNFSFRQYSSWEGIGWISGRMNQFGYELSLINKEEKWTCYFSKEGSIGGFLAESKYPWDAVIECALHIRRPVEAK